MCNVFESLISKRPEKFNFCINSSYSKVTIWENLPKADGQIHSDSCEPSEDKNNLESKKIHHGYNLEWGYFQKKKKKRMGIFQIEERLHLLERIQHGCKLAVPKTASNRFSGIHMRPILSLKMYNISWPKSPVPEQEQLWALRFVRSLEVCRRQRLCVCVWVCVCCIFSIWWVHGVR